MLPLPARSSNALAGTEFSARVAGLELAEREEQLCSEILSGNVPDFLRRLCLVQVTNVSDGRTNAATFFVTPDYLAVGSDTDYVLMPISPQAGQRIADALHCSLPTRKMVDAIYAAAPLKLAPTPIPPSPAMTTIAVFSNHNALVRQQRALELGSYPLGTLTAGQKKDVVITARLEKAPAKVAIYGWHKTNGTPIQPLYLGHTAAWVDYSQCTRLVQQAMVVNGQTTTLAAVLANSELAGLLSDEGPLPNPRYATNVLTKALPSASTNMPGKDSALHFRPSQFFNERVGSLLLEPEVRISVNAPAVEDFAPGKKVLLVFYALPNGNTIEQTVGKRLEPGDDWHFDIQHIGAQTRFLRHRLRDRLLVVAYLENGLKSWPAWRRKYGDQRIPEIVNVVKTNFPGRQVELILSSHSGGGSFIFGYLNTLHSIPEDVVRIAFLDSDYGYDQALGHSEKLSAWLKKSRQNALCVFAYNDAVALLDGKPFVSAAGGTWGKSHELQRDLAGSLSFTSQTNAEFQIFTALNGRVQFLLKENPERKILHTVQVERNGFIHSMLCGKPAENQGYEYFGPRAYSEWIQGAILRENR